MGGAPTHPVLSPWTPAASGTGPCPFTTWKAAAGLAINFDFLTPKDALAHTIFVNSYLFLEVDYSWADGFGDAKKFDMSDTQFQFGVSFDFE